MLVGLKDTLASNKFITPWSFIHFMSGVVMYRLNPNIYLGLFLHTLYELKDIYMSTRVKNKNIDGWGNDSILNSLGDTLFFWIGQIVSNKINLSTQTLITFYISFFVMFLSNGLG